MPPMAAVSPPTIAIIGAGVAGLAVAALLADRGYHPVILERFAAARPVGSGLLIQPTGLAVLDHLGLRQTAMALCARIDRLHGCLGPSGKTIFDLRYDGLLPGLHGLALHRASLFHILWQAVAARRIDIEPAIEVVEADRLSGKRIALIDGNARRHGPFDLVIDASGAHTRLREPIHRNIMRPYRFGAVWGAVRDTGFDRTALQQRYRGASRMIGVLPIGCLPDDPTPLNALFWSLPADEHTAWTARGVNAWRDEAAAIWPETITLTEQFETPGHLSLARYAQLTMMAPFAGRLVHIGDAAHQTSPQLGQGGNMALIDAAALADALAASSDIDAALAAYAARRRAHVRFYQRASAALTPFFQSNWPVAGFARDLAFGPVSRLPFFRTEMIRTLAGLKTGLLTSNTAERLTRMATRPDTSPPLNKHLRSI